MTLLFRATTPFQSTLPRRERQTLDGFISLLDNFNSRSREGSDVCHHCLAAVLIAISIHAPAKGATVPSTKSFADGSKFQSTLPRRERRLQCGMLCSCYLFQSTLPRRERLLVTSLHQKVEIISTHAPAKGATGPDWLYSAGYPISIHAPAKGATTSVQHAVLVLPISIHAPTKGATVVQDFCKIPAQISIHAPAKGATFDRLRAACFRRRFQSTLPRRERHARPEQQKGEGYFNPRSREGSDNPVRATTNSLELFQSTLPRRERRANLQHLCLVLHFNPRSREGSDAYRSVLCECVSHFNPRSREGSDIAVIATDATPTQFQSTLPRRERPSCCRWVVTLSRFQSTLPRRER